MTTNNSKTVEKNAEQEASEFVEKLVHVNRCSKVVKGGRRFSFAALVVVGDQNGSIGVGNGKAKEVPDAIRKASEYARKHLITVALAGDTIPHKVLGVHDGGKVILRPASTGTGVIAGGAARAVLEVAGIKNILSKSLGSNNHRAVVNATINALSKLRSAATIRRIRGYSVGKKSDKEENSLSES